MSRKQSGFTLVEIAIVLVIIGLLLGGILKGQELINSAKVRNLADQATGIQAAYFGFIDRYRQVPGDMLVADAQSAIDTAITAGGVTTANGGNGQVDETSWAEASALWVHLTRAGFLQGSYAGGAADATTYRAPNMAPVNAYNGYMLLARSRDYSSTAGAPTTTGTAPRLLLVMGDNIPVDIARELDVKMDDQNPLSGVLRLTMNSGATAPSFSGVSESTSTNCTAAATTNAWDIGQDAQNCNLAFLY
jgi:prepilin-type N-terminal cleavage/methylation domain-containing protein